MAERLRILVAESDPDKLAWLESALTGSDILCVPAKSLAELYTLADQQRFDVILLDPELKDSHGSESLQSVRRRLPDLPVVVLLPSRAHSQALDSIGKGAQGFILVGELDARSMTAVLVQADERQKTINVIREGQRKLDNLISNLPGFVYRCKNDADWTMEYLSEGFTKLTGYAVDELIHKTTSYNELIHPHDRKRIRQAIQKTIKQDGHFQIEYLLLCKDGSEKWMWEQGNLIKRGTPQEMLEGYVTDITEWKTREQHLQSLITIGTVLRDIHKVQEILSAVLQNMNQYFGIGSAALMMPSNQAGFLRFEAAWGGLHAWEGREIEQADFSGVTSLQTSTVLQIERKDKTESDCPIFGVLPEKFLAFIPLEFDKGGQALLVCARETVFKPSELEVFTAIGRMLISALERAELQLNMEKQLKRLESLRAIDLAISAIYDIQVILKMILDQIIKELGADAADVLVFNRVSNSLEFSEARGFLDPQMKYRKVPLTTSLAGRILLENQSQMIPDLGQFSTDLPDDKRRAGDYSSYFGAPISIKGTAVGVLEAFFSNPFYADEEWQSHFETLATRASMAFDSHRKFTELQKMQQNMAASLLSTIESWSKTVELHALESQGHIRRVTAATLQLARKLGVPEQDLPDIERGALLHDIGKIGVLEEILHKKGELSEEEWTAIKRHPEIARELLSDAKLLEEALDIPYCHHENWDGSGYPQGLKGEEIPISARIFAVVETLDALTSERPYRKAWTRDKAIEYLVEQKGKKFDPQVVDQFLSS